MYVQQTSKYAEEYLTGENKINTHVKEQRFHRFWNS